ncbi:MAG: 4Fe-4S binding protein [Deltaproteobacteria bacterium]|nr:4Fe-4S binding protein [Deltaproteobacteria bacterium]MBT4265707.1 4Fe-4S binding protein [Deltaproteobacteria bacterium]MBT4641799.1 4Fe-4S binding protein [Deltaproteobacteria bacterium]MBT6503471.1 4Fe-4S binding protein [Deltaproteobacteria bacterium]MBT7155203.1 4Fe-4S binding protein [Deltaproteobacteria bacterium]
MQAIKDLKYKGGFARTNFEPVIDHDDCDLCETCADMCPIEVMSLGQDDSDELKLSSHSSTAFFHGFSFPPTRFTNSNFRNNGTLMV